METLRTMDTMKNVPTNQTIRLYGTAKTHKFEHHEI